jgi:hypothetical protein
MFAAFFPVVHWRWENGRLLITFSHCGHQIEDRPPRHGMRDDAITNWLWRIYAWCPQCQRHPLDRS